MKVKKPMTHVLREEDPQKQYTHSYYVRTLHR